MQTTKQSPSTGTNTRSIQAVARVLRPYTCKKKTANKTQTPRPHQPPREQPHHVPRPATAALSSLQLTLRPCTLSMPRYSLFHTATLVLPNELYFLHDASFRICSPINIICKSGEQEVVSITGRKKTEQAPATPSAWQPPPDISKEFD